MSNQPGSGFIVGPRHILTAAHVLFPTTGPLKDQAPLSVEVSPGRNKNSTPYGSYTSTTYRVRPEWRSGGNNTFDARFDFAMIKVSNEIANTGLKYWGANGTSTHRYPISRNWLRGKVVNVGGYPRDKKPNTQWISHDVLDEPEPTRNGQRMKNVFRYKADTCTGQSGAPVWWWDGANDRYLVGIHTGACDFLDGCTAVNGTGCLPGNRRWSHNRGLLLSHEVDKQIKAWVK